MANELIVGQIALTFHTAAAAVMIELLKELGHTVSVKEAPHEQMYEWHSKGEVDLVCSAWLPASHEIYLNPYLDQVEKLAVIYEPYCVWGIPDNMPEALTSIEQLAEPEYAALFCKLIQGIGPGAGISRFSRQMVEDYQLAQQGFHFENGGLPDCTGAYIDAIEAGEAAIVPLWHPQWLHSYTQLRELKDPKGLLGGQDDATLVIRKDAIPNVSEAGMRLLRNMYLGNTTVSELDYEICRNGKTPAEAAKSWIAANRDTCDAWIGGSGNGV